MGKRLDMSTRQVQYSALQKPSADTTVQLPAIWTPTGFHYFGDLTADSPRWLSGPQPATVKSPKAPESRQSPPIDVLMPGMPATPPSAPPGPKGPRPLSNGSAGGAAHQRRQHQTPR